MKIWDLPTRLFHWLIALPVLLNYILEGGESPHKILGYIALVALVARIYWGLVGGEHSRFRSFPLSLHKVRIYLVSLLTATPKNYVGHNPMASWVYLGIWLMVFLLGVSGFMMGLDAFWGEEWLEKTHGALATITKFMVLGHFLGILVDTIKFKRKTWLAMITGKKE